MFSQQTWAEEDIPQDFKDASVIHLHKRKGNRQPCDNHIDSLLPSITGKSLAWNILICPICNRADRRLLSESQRYSSTQLGTIDTIFATLRAGLLQADRGLGSQFSEGKVFYISKMFHILNGFHIFKGVSHFLFCGMVA